MSRESYFSQYASPNIIIVPTVSFSPPSAAKSDTTANNNCALKNKQHFIKNSDLQCSKKVKETEVNTHLSLGTVCSTATRITDNPKSVPYKNQDSILTECPPSINHGIKEVSSSIYKSRNNLVDLTGFNILKRDSMSSSKDKDRNHKDVSKRNAIKKLTKVKEELIKTVSDSYTKDRKCIESSDIQILSSSKESSINTKSNQSEENAAEMEDKMKKYFRQLRRRNLDKIKSKIKTNNEKVSKRIKSAKAKEHSKDHKLKPSQSKTKSNRESSKSRSLSKSNEVKNYTEDKKKFKPEPISTSKSATKTSDRECNLKSGAAKRYENFQRFLQHLNGDKSSHESGEHTDNTSRIPDKTSTKTDRVLNKKLEARKQLVRKNKDKLEQDKQATNKNQNSVSQSKSNTEKQDLRSKLRLKRKRSECQKTAHNEEQENLVITVNQKNRKTPVKHTPPAKKVKSMKFKKIKLVINIECPASTDSDDSEHNNDDCSQTSTQDLSFLDDFNVDEIVKSLDICHDSLKDKDINKTKNSSVIEKTNLGKKKMCTAQVEKPKERLINDVQIKSEKEENQVIVIDSGSEDEGLTKGSNTCRNMNEQTLETDTIGNKKCTKHNIFEEHIHNITDTILNNKSDKMFNTNNVILHESNKGKENTSLKQLTKSCKSDNNSLKYIKEQNNTNKSDTKPFSKINTKAKKVTQETSQNNAEIEKLSKSVNTNIIAKVTKKTSTEKTIEVSHKTISNNNEQGIVVKKDVELIKIPDENSNNSEVVIHSQNKDPVEKSLETMFEYVNQNIDINDKPPNRLFNECIKNETPPEDTIEKSLETMFSGVKDIQDINVNMRLPNVPNEQQIKEQIISSQHSEITIDSCEELNDFELINKSSDVNTNDVDIDLKYADTVKLSDNNTILENRSKERTAVIEMDADLLKNAETVETSCLSSDCTQTSENTLENSHDTNVKVTNVSEIIDNISSVKETIKSHEEVKNIIKERVDIQIDVKSNDTTEISKNSKDTIKAVLKQTNDNTVVIAKTINTKDAKTSDENNDIKIVEVAEKSMNINAEKSTTSEAKMKPNMPSEKSLTTAGVSKEKRVSIKGKSNTEEKQVKSVVTINNNVRTLSNKKHNDSLHKEGFIKNNYIKNTHEKKIESLAPLKSKQFIGTLETRLLNDLHVEFKVSSIIHQGYFSVIYKCKDITGETYALKVINPDKPHRGFFMEKTFSTLQSYTCKENSCLLFMINGFEINRSWCFLTEYYPKNLQQAMTENAKTFHIDVVQNLSRQLVAAVTMLTMNNIIHTDIKPTHILLNASNERLKLGGFDRALYSYKLKILPSVGTASYRPPEVILGFPADCRIDVWSTALVMFEMVSSTQLFPGKYNNDILYKQICTLGSFDYDMINESRYKNMYFDGASFIRRIREAGSKFIRIHAFHRNHNLRNQIFKSYRDHWEWCRSAWQVTEDLDKLESFHTLLEQMLVLNPQHRLVIHYVGASDFIHELMD